MGIAGVGTVGSDIQFPNEYIAKGYLDLRNKYQYNTVQEDKPTKRKLSMFTSKATKEYVTKLENKVSDLSYKLNNQQQLIDTLIKKTKPESKFKVGDKVHYQLCQYPYLASEGFVFDVKFDPTVWEYTYKVKLYKNNVTYHTGTPYITSEITTKEDKLTKVDSSVPKKKGKK